MTPILIWTPAINIHEDILQIQLGKFSKAEDTLIGIIELVSLGLYVVPQTSVFGAILMTGHLGGAIATHVRVDSPMFTRTLFPIYVASPRASVGRAPAVAAMTRGAAVPPELVVASRLILFLTGLAAVPTA
jgi:DoxX-like family